MNKPAINIFGGGYQRAAKEHTCWLCGETIAKGEGYFRTAIPIVQIREWKIRPVQPAQDEAA